MDWLLLAGFCGFLFFFGLAYFGLLGADEPRYAQVAREMLARHDWITPTLGGKPWLEKPALYYWQAMLAYSVFGVSDWAARLPSALDATLMVVAVYLFLRRFRPGFQLDGALMTASASGVIGFARAASTDMPLAATFTIAMLAWYAWYESAGKRYLAMSYIFLGLAMLAKGPVAPFLAAVIVIVFATAKGDYRPHGTDLLGTWHRAVRSHGTSVVRGGAVEKPGILSGIHSGTQPGTIRKRSLSPYSALLVLPARRPARTCSLDRVCHRHHGGNHSRMVGRKEGVVSVGRCPGRVSRDLADRSGRILFFFRIEIAGLHCAGPSGRHAAAGGICSAPRQR
jgi:hypothetical protein